MALSLHIDIYDMNCTNMQKKCKAITLQIEINAIDCTHVHI